MYKKTLASDGIAGLYRGFVISAVGIFIYRGLYFGMYDSFKPLLGIYEDNFLVSDRRIARTNTVHSSDTATLLATSHHSPSPPLAPLPAPPHPQVTFGMGWGITIAAGLASYPIDTVRRRMMMTSGQAVKYKNSLDAFNQIVAKEGTKSLFKGAGANVLRAIAGAGVLSGYDQLQVIVFGKKFSSGGG